MLHRARVLTVVVISLSGLLACTGSGSGPSGTAGSSGGTAGATGTAGNPGGTAGANGTAGASGTAGANGTAGATGTAGNPGGTAGANGTAGATGSAGANGTAGASGTAGAVGTAGATGGDASCNVQPYRALNVTATKALHVHGNAGIDTRAAKILGKLGVNLGVSGGGYSSWLGKRGYHVVGSSYGECAAPNLGAGRDAVGTCRLGEWAMVKGQVETSLRNLATTYADEDWGYFFVDATMKEVRWNDVAFTGVSHGATTAALIGHMGTCIWRAVSCAGPRDNTCGNGMGAVPYDPAKPPYDPNCDVKNIASWLDAPSKTPMDRFYGLVGTTDGQYGDIMFNMQRTKYPGPVVQFNLPNADLTGAHRLITSAGGHLDFVNAADNVKPPGTEAALCAAFAIPPEDCTPTFQ